MVDEGNIESKPGAQLPTQRPNNVINFKIFIWDNFKNLEEYK